jgi:hypothetical protein
MLKISLFLGNLHVYLLSITSYVGDVLSLQSICMAGKSFAGARTKRHENPPLSPYTFKTTIRNSDQGDQVIRKHLQNKK